MTASSRPKRRALPVALAISVALCASTRADKTEAEVRAEIEFARGLAAEWSFVDMAETVLANVESEGAGRLEESLALVKCEVFAIGARNESDVPRSHELFERALTSYSEFVEDNPFSELRPSAEAALVDTSAIFARSISAALEEAVGEEADALRERRRVVLTDAVTRTQSLMEELQSQSDRTEQQTRDLYGLMLNRGNMLAEISSGDQDAGAFFFEQALETLEGLAFEAGEGTPWALRAYVAMGELYNGKGDHSTASDFLSAVVDQSMPRDPQEWAQLVEQGISEAEKNTRFLFVELATGPLMESYSNVGDLEAGTSFGLHMLNVQRREGFTLSPRGHVGLLAVAKILLDAGGYVGGDLIAGNARWFETEEEMKDAVSQRRLQRNAVDLSLSLAQEVYDENRGNVLQVRAQKLIAEIINLPGVPVSPDLLFQAAEGHYFENSYQDALQGFRRVLAAIEPLDQAERIQFGAKVMNKIANTFRKMDRPLEASMAFREGATTWAGDPEYDNLNADGYYKMISQVQGAAKSETEELDKLVAEAEQIVARAGSRNKDQVFFDLGKKAKRAKNWDKAILEFGKIGKGSDFWEKGQVEIAVSTYRKGDGGEALRLLDLYMDEYLVSAEAKAETGTNHLVRRKEAMATGDFYRGLILDGQADASSDPALYQRIVDLLGDFYLNYPEQTKLVPWTMKLVMGANLALDDRDAARTMLATLVEKHPDNKWAGAASEEFYKTLEKLLEKNTEPEQHNVILREMAELLERGNATAAQPAFANMRSESQHWLELGEWAKAESVLKKIVDQFGGDAARKATLQQHVKADLGHALLMQQNVVEAKEVLGPLVADEELRAAKDTVLDWTRSVTGWVEGSGTDIQVIVGAGEGEEFQGAVDKISAIAASSSYTKWTDCAWYELKFMIAFAYFAWGQTDSRKIDSAKNQLGIMAAEAGDDFESVADWCDPKNSEDVDPAVRARLGGGVLHGHFKWLQRQLR